MSTENIGSSKTDEVVRKNYSCLTRMKFRTYSLRWTIADYDIVSKTVKLLKSPEFPLDDKETEKWFIEFEPTEISQHNENKLEVRLRRTFSNEIYVYVSLSMENDCGKVQNFDELGCVMHPATHIHWSDLSGKALQDKLVWNDRLDKNLIITCTVRAYDSTEHFCRKMSPKSYESNNLIQDISIFFADNKTLQDVTIFVQEKKIGAHKAILSARSKVFEAMFSHDMSEKLNSSFEIEDFEPETIETMIRFIYTDEVDDSNLRSSAHELFAAADKYDLKRLKEICITYMRENVAIDNVLKTLEVADIYSILDLKKMSAKFVSSHRKDVKNLNEFKTLIAKRPHLMMEFWDIEDDRSDNEDQVLKATLKFRSGSEQNLNL